MKKILNGKMFIYQKQNKTMTLYKLHTQTEQL